MTKVLIFSQEYPPYSWGGVTPFTVNLVNGLKKLGLGILLVTIGDKEEFYQQRNGVKVYRFFSKGLYQKKGVREHFSLLHKIKEFCQKQFCPKAVILADDVSFLTAKGCADHFNVP